jgi:uncharacterized protein YndB with AHSA1/START domain
MARKKFTLEYIIRSSPAILFEFCTNTSSLAQWFSEYADSNGDTYTFGWTGGSYEKAELQDWVDEERVRYHWVNAPKNEYFQFRIYKSEISFETVLEVTDFCDEKELKDQTFLWDNQIEALKHAIGAY